MRILRSIWSDPDCLRPHQKSGVYAVMRREFCRMCSRPLYLAMTFVIPLLSLLFFATFLDKGLPDQMPVVTLDLDQSPTSRMVLRNISAIPTVNVQKETGSFKEALDEMQQGNAYAILSVPKNFQADLLAQRQPQVLVYTQFGYLVGGSLLMRDLNLSLSMLSAGVNMKVQQSRGEVEEVIRPRLQPIVTDLHTMFNPWTNYSIYLSTTMLPGILQLMVFLTTIFAVGSELKSKTSRVWLLTAGKSIGKAVLGKILPYTMVFTLMIWAYDGVFHGLLHYPMNGSYVRILFGGLLFVLAQQSMGLFIIGLIPVLRDALSMGAVLGTLGLTFSGLTFPITGMIPVIQAWSCAFPIRQYYLIYVHEALMGTPWFYSWQHYVFLCLYMFLPFLVLIRLKKALVRQNFPLG